MYGLHTSKHHSGLTLYFLIKLEIDVMLDSKVVMKL
ncbi:hypothetical protein JL09_g6990 [Pichia kudriavzevii]|uniref:Uncharacterized protein n=1 Tax=Pichia kudriavzevii TaxID=4909 RepID=A0A099NIA8_PICKU|nr:hypothetical protein JL09_g6990 [Pichia kudriavzevii]